jgi:Xaa-Pro dipeptidase
MIFLDIMHSFNGYHTCYYRTFICGKPNKHQTEAYEKAFKWLSDAIDVIKPGATTADIAAAWPEAKDCRDVVWGCGQIGRRKDRGGDCCDQRWM